MVTVAERGPTPNFRSKTRLLSELPTLHVPLCSHLPGRMIRMLGFQAAAEIRPAKPAEGGLLEAAAGSAASGEEGVATP